MLIHLLFIEIITIYKKLSLVVAQGQKYETPSENQTHHQWSTNLIVRCPLKLNIAYIYHKATTSSEGQTLYSDAMDLWN